MKTIIHGTILSAFAETSDFSFLIFQNQSVAGNVIQKIKKQSTDDKTIPFNRLCMCVLCKFE